MVQTTEEQKTLLYSQIDRINNGQLQSLKGSLKTPCFSDEAMGEIALELEKVSTLLTNMK